MYWGECGVKVDRETSPGIFHSLAVGWKDRQRHSRGQLELSVQITRSPVPSSQPIHPLQKAPESWAMSADPVYIFWDQSGLGLYCGLGTQPRLAEPPYSQHSGYPHGTTLPVGWAVRTVGSRPFLLGPWASLAHPESCP